MKRLTRRAGLSLVEVTVGIALLGVSGGAIMLASNTAADAMRTGSILSELDVQGSRAIDQIADAISTATRGDVLPAAPAAVAPFHTNALDFQSSVFVDAEVTLTDWARVGFEYSPGEANDNADNDGNGLVDEGMVVLTTDVGLDSERRTVICRWVRESLERELSGNGLDDNDNGLRDESGLSFDFNGDRVTIRLTLERADSNGLLVARSFERTIAFRK